MKAEQAEALLDYEDVEGFEQVTEAEQYESSRWMAFYSKVYRNTSDGTFWEILWARGLTEMQDDGVEDISVRQVVPVEKTITVYEAAP